MPSSEAPVVVIGAGLAGATCAAELTRAGVRVVLLEAEPVPGGSARWAVGSLTAAGSRQQRLAGIVDTCEDHVRDLLAMCELPDRGYEPLLRRMCADGPDTLDRLTALGVEFAGPFLEPPHTRARMHNAVPHAAALIDAVLSHSSATVRTGVGVIDIERRGHDGFTLTTTDEGMETRAVVIASGDLSAADPQVPAMNPAATGEPIAAAGRLGGQADPPPVTPGLRMPTPAGPWIAPTDELVAAATVVDGRRRLPGRGPLTEPRSFAGRPLWLELDESAVPDPARLATYPGVGYGDLARFERDGLADRTGRTLRIGPLYMVVTLADGGLRVDGDMHVRDRADRPIPGLYACGAAALGPTQLAGHGHHLLWAAVTGQWAAQAVKTTDATARSTA